MHANRDLWGNLVAPIAVNLISAAMLFVAALFFRSAILSFFGVGPEPVLHAVVEPYNNDAGEVLGDLFLINLRGERYNENELTAALQEETEDAQRRPELRITWAAGTGRVTGVESDAVFNEGKGKVSIDAPPRPDGDWVIRIEELESRAVLRFTITTNLPRITRRSAKASLPFEVFLAGQVITD